MIEELKPCPFCGSSAEYTSIDQEFVRCSKGLKCPSEAQVYTVEDWNTRPIEDAQRRALTEILELCSTGGFISTDARFKIISHTAKKALLNK
ncbi:MAG: Lar family restriction alleviation protein [Lentisphaeria bacterium]|nr:Lar family restriction alleviation protein [Lentisphaeria bacterium]